jgi:tRNA G26 N,N-dimethylase Trm1
MCDSANCKHVYTPNKPATLTTEDQASLWADIKAARKALEARVAFLGSLGFDAVQTATDGQMIKLEALTRSLWAKFRVL